MAKKTSPAPRNGDVDRLSTGIPGLDKFLEGGFVKGSTVLLTGGAGTGKTIFCIQFLLEGLRKGERCLYITLEESPEDIINDCARFGWDLASYLDKGLLTIEYKDPFEMIDV